MSRHVIVPDTSTRAKAARAERLMPNGIPRWIRCYDNGGESADQYTVVFTGRYTQKTAGMHWYVGMSEDPYHPQGVGLHGETQGAVDTPHGQWPPALGRTGNCGRRIRFQDLPADCQHLVRHDYHYLWDLGGVEADPTPEPAWGQSAPGHEEA